MRKIGLLVLALLLAVSVVNAQTSQRVLDRIDQAMAHLTEYLGLDSPITRQTNFWSWEEVIYGDASFGCGRPGVNYPSEPDRAFQITIAESGVDYDYRLSGDGTILVLCGADGQPIFRSDDATLNTGNQPVQPPQAVPQGVDFNVWIYMQTQQRFYLINETGEVASINRPMATNEDPFGSNILQMVFSRDGRYLVQVIQLNTGNIGLTISDLQTGAITLVPVGLNEEVSLGRGDDPGTTSIQVGSSLIFNESNTQVAVSFADLNNVGPSSNAWRIAVINLADGTTVNQLQYNVAPTILQNSDPGLTDALTGNGVFQPIPVLFDSDGNIHVRMILMFAGGAENYPTFVWSPSGNTVEPSPFTGVDMDILPDGRTVFPALDPNLPAPPQPPGPGTNYNAITQADLLAPAPDSRYIFAGTTQAVFGPNWADGGEQVIYRTPTGNPGEFTYLMYRLSDDSEFVLPDVAVGVPGGALSIVEGPASPEIAYYEDGATSAVIWPAPPQNGRPIFAWTQITGVPLGLTSVANDQTGQPPVVQATPMPQVTPLSPPTPVVGNNECGDFPSIVQIGVTARSTVVDGSPLNVRDAPNVTTAQVARIVPENTRFQVVDGPRCADGYTWWQVRLQDGLVGWVAEAGSEFYFIEPAP
jgi:hypothetical protein